MNAEQMKNIDIRTVDPKDLVERQSVKVDMSLPREERIKQYIKQIKNPYCYLDGDVVVKVSFREEGVTLEQRLEAYIRSL
ncbi:DUF6870 family protein [[Clostridium] innocuum]|uniref:DUF6870 family protein n=1 Tax=Clostridium innocuum TaxID=1522 RepID=UPI000C2FE615|nr:hypothetical protein [[Clostridium] innocuum]MCR0174014.1 hypothetical protein [[Clostridium] innocuum]MCR0642943.1 hypothetical protein [[Clostridium] innocuum]